MGRKYIESECTEATRAEARRFYEAYIANSDGLNYQGLPCPKWEDLPAAIRGHWCAVAVASDRRLEDPTDDEHG